MTMVKTFTPVIIVCYTNGTEISIENPFTRFSAEAAFKDAKDIIRNSFNGK